MWPLLLFLLMFLPCVAHYVTTFTVATLHNFARTDVALQHFSQQATPTLNRHYKAIQVSHVNIITVVIKGEAGNMKPVAPLEWCSISASEIHIGKPKNPLSAVPDRT